MSAQPIVIHAEVDARERPAAVAGAQQLSQALHVAAGVKWPVQLTFWDAGQLAEPLSGGCIVVLSLLADAEKEEAFHETEARWRSRIEGLATYGTPILVLTVFRAVHHRSSAAGQRLLELSAG